MAEGWGKMEPEGDLGGGQGQGHKSPGTKKPKLNISENCKRFNRIFHCTSTEDESSTSSSIEGLPPEAKVKVKIEPSIIKVEADDIDSPNNPNLKEEVTGRQQEIKLEPFLEPTMEEESAVDLSLSKVKGHDSRSPGAGSCSSSSSTSTSGSTSSSSCGSSCSGSSTSSSDEDDDGEEVSSPDDIKGQGQGHRRTGSGSSSLPDADSVEVRSNKVKTETLSSSSSPRGTPHLHEQDQGQIQGHGHGHGESPSTFTVGERKSRRLTSSSSAKTAFCNKKHEAQIMKRLTKIIRKPTPDLTPEDHDLMESFPTLAQLVRKRLERRVVAFERLKEFEEPLEVLEEKVIVLAEAIRRSKYMIIYTGAGISTSASIPDYRGPKGIWTLLKNGQSLEGTSPLVLTTADPTLTHMALKELYSRGNVKHVVSQNCDGLHLRSGIPKEALSEVHGNMYVEVCPKCNREYVRKFDVTEQTRRYEHRTGRRCYRCGTYLKDTVVHFGERGSLRWPLNWAGAEYNANNADTILCLGSSLKVLRRYPWLWGMDRPANKRPKLIIVNLQWTPKDQFAALKIHGKCDWVMERVMTRLGIAIPAYHRETDPIFSLATPLHHSELTSKSSADLTLPPGVPLPPLRPNTTSNYIRYEPISQVPMDSLLSGDDPGGTNSPKLRSANKDSSKTTAKGQGQGRGRPRSITKSKVKEAGGGGGGEDKDPFVRRPNSNGWLGNAWGVKPKKRRIGGSSKAPPSNLIEK